MSGDNKSAMEERFEAFCNAWGVDVDVMPELGRIEMIRNYYLDVIASMMTARPKEIVFPHGVGPPRR
jgi:hypothetical protein